MNRFLCVAAAILLLCSSAFPAHAGVKVTIADDLEGDRDFLVTTDIYYWKPEGHHVKHIDGSFLRAGGTKHVTVLAVWPLLYSYTYAYAFHPAYYSDSVKSDKTPFALRTVVMPALRPESWRRLLKSGESPRGRGGSIVPWVVNHHFSLILSHYLPAFDRARIKEDLSQHLPLLRDLAAFAHREGVYKRIAAAVAPGQGPLPRQDDRDPQPEILERYRSEMDERLREITAWLALEQDKRAAMHDWMERFQRGDYVYRQMMSDGDRARLLQWLDRCIEGAAERTLQWTSQASGVLYIARDNGTVSSGPDVANSVHLTVDLNPILGLQNRRYIGQSHPYFYRDARGMWEVKQVVGRP